MYINYKESGSGRDILLIHGFSDDLFFWNPLMSTFDNCHVLRIDLPGYGKSSKIINNLTMTGFVEEIVKLIIEKYV